MKYIKMTTRAAQRGFTALETIVVLIVAVAALGLGGQYLSNYADNLSNQAAADHQKAVSDAAVKYIKDNYAAILATATATTPATITVPMLKSTGYLSSSFNNQNPFGQDYQILALEPTANKLETLIVTTGGETVPEMGVRRIAQLVGAQGGFISATDTTKAQGSYGGWQMALSSYGASPGAGHLASALFFADGALVSDYLYRNTVAGHPELNQMNTAIDMTGNNVNNAGQVNANKVAAAADVTAGGNVTATGNVNAANANISGETTTGGWFRNTGDTGWYNQKWNGGWFMSDSNWVRSYADKNVYTGGQMQAGTMRSNGRLSTGEFAQIDGYAVEGGACPGGNVIAIDANTKLTLSCQSGVWRASGAVFGGPNWIKFGATGLIMQWGKSSICGPTNNGSMTGWQSFPIPFPSGSAQTLQATLTGAYPGGGKIWHDHSVRSFISGNSFYFWVAAPNNGGFGACYGIDWFATGF